MNNKTLLIIAVIALLLLPRLLGGLFNIIGIVLAVVLLIFIFNEKWRTRLIKFWKFYNRKRK